MRAKLTRLWYAIHYLVPLMRVKWGREFWIMKLIVTDLLLQLKHKAIRDSIENEIEEKKGFIGIKDKFVTSLVCLYDIGL